MRTAVLILLLLPSPLIAAEIRTLTGKHLTLHTDVPANPEVDALPAVFDRAFEQWCEYFKLDPRNHANWHVDGILLRGPASRERFIAAGMMPADLWDFKSGYSTGKKLWLYDQTSDYYRRHLLFHEGVHCLMTSLLGGYGPPWYAEGMAELLGTHKLENGKLTVNYFPRNRKEVPKLGRLEIVQEAIENGRTKSLGDIAQYGATAHRENEPYAWCWAAAAFLDGHPRYQQRFRELPAYASRQDFMSQFNQAYQSDVALLDEEWQVYLANLDYAYDFARMQLTLEQGAPLTATTESVDVPADRGWQSSGIELEAGKKYRLQASGQFQVANRGKPWISEAGGVTIRYVHGQPLGLLLAVVRPDDLDATHDQTPLASPQPIGLDSVLTPTHSGTLYLRINDAPGELADNSGKLTVRITRVPD